MSLCIRVTPLLYFLHKFILANEQRCKEVAFVDDSSIVGKIKEIRTYWEMKQEVGLLYGYFPKPFKFYLIRDSQEG